MSAFQGSSLRTGLSWCRVHGETTRQGSSFTMPISSTLAGVGAMIHGVARKPWALVGRALRSSVRCAGDGCAQSSVCSSLPFCRRCESATRPTYAAANARTASMTFGSARRVENRCAAARSRAKEWQCTERRRGGNRTILWVDACTALVDGCRLSRGPVRCQRPAMSVSTHGGTKSLLEDGIGAAASAQLCACTTHVASMTTLICDVSTEQVKCVSAR